MKRKTRVWIVSLHARSAVRLERNERIFITATPESIPEIAAVRIRNDWKRTDAKTYVGGIVVEAAGRCRDGDEAASLLGNIAAPYFQLLAIAANASISEDYETHVYAPPKGKQKGLFISERPAQAYQPTAKMRKLKAQPLSDFLQGIQVHHREDRLHRAIAHYRLALEHLNPNNWVFPAEFLYIATEALAPVIYDRICRERGLGPKLVTTKEVFAKEQGFKKSDAKPTQHLYEVDSWVRRNYIFDGKHDVYSKLKFASEHLEHSSREFGQVRNAAAYAAPLTFGLLRRAILREAGVPADSPLFAPDLDEPLGSWRPALQLRGTYTDSETLPGPGFTRETAPDDWPQFLGLNLQSYISQVQDTSIAR